MKTKLIIFFFSALLLFTSCANQLKHWDENRLTDLNNIKIFNGNYSNGKSAGNVNRNEFLWFALVSNEDYSDSTNIVSVSVLNDKEIELILKRSSGMFMNKAILNYTKRNNHIVLPLRQHFHFFLIPIFQNWWFEDISIGINSENALEINRMNSGFLLICFVPTPIGGGGGGPGEIIVYNKIKAQDNEAKTEKDQNHT
jgi:hypothetical protein